MSPKIQAPAIEHQCNFEPIIDEYSGCQKEFSKCLCGAVSNFVSYRLENEVERELRENSRKKFDKPKRRWIDKLIDWIFSKL